ncbi:MAG: LysM peptidoglycan-binding domain-containing protein [Chloroflexi bacterium]|nr:LysM peptidoglycan-binding domain-containing protein [Chloroflexota bacterium]
MRQSIIVVAITLVVGILSRGEIVHAVGTPTPSSTRLTETQTTYQIYTVKSGDTFWRIARNYKISLTTLLAANPTVNPARLSIGQRLLIPQSKALRRTTPRFAARVRATPRPSPTARGDVITYVVRPGDTIWRIATEYGVSVKALMQANRIGQPNMLVVGQVLVIPGPALAPTPTPAPASPTPVEQTPSFSVASATSTPTPTPLPANIADWPRRIAEMINELRAEHGLPPLAWSDALARAAQDHANACARQDFCSHIGPDGSRLRDRLKRVGYEASWAGENWVYAHNAERGVEWWYDEPPGADPHRQNILASHYSEIGVGVARGRWGKYYIVANFARP